MRTADFVQHLISVETTSPIILRFLQGSNMTSITSAELLQLFGLCLIIKFFIA